MKFSAFLVVLVFFGTLSCKNELKPIVDTHFTDSLIQYFSASAFEGMLKSDFVFWENRLDANPTSQTALLRHAGGLVQRFHTYGDIQDLIRADSLYRFANRSSLEKEAGILRSLASLAITRHRFREADRYVQKALAAGSEKYASTLLLFDTQFEIGAYTLAEQALRSCAATNEYGYFFRLSKWKHFQGETDSAVWYMQKAADWAGNSLYLKQTALSNMADLYLHEGKLQAAYDLYRKNLLQNASDFHSLQGIGRITLVHDRSPEKAESLFRFLAQKNKLPDAIYNLIWLEEQKGDTAAQRKAATEFAGKATDTLYGGMYHKYLIEQYTGVLNEPGKALALSEKEMRNRATPQTYAWQVWSLHKTGKDEQAMALYQSKVSGKPLEALELYWMGKMMKDLGKAYNAKAFFTAAEKNLNDLSPVKQMDLKSLLQ